MLATVHDHWTITSHVVTQSSSVRAVNWDLVVVGAKSVSMSVRVVQKSALKHPVIAWFDSGHQVRRSKCGLFSLSVIISGVAVQHQLANWDQGVVRVRPYFGDIVNIESVLKGVLFWHGLHKPGPRRDAAFFNVVVEIVGGEL